MSGKSKKTVTQKKVKVHGTQRFAKVDANGDLTGEFVDMEVIQMEARDFNFSKIWIAHVLESLEAIGNKKIKVLNFLMDNMDSQNRVIATQREIAEKLEVSFPIVNETIKLLKDSEFLIQKQQGVYMINPNCIFKGHHDHRMNVLLQYHIIKDNLRPVEIEDNPEEKKEQKEPKKQKKSAKTSHPENIDYNKNTTNIVQNNNIH